MSIKTTYNFKGVEVKDAIIRVDRLWGSSKEGWTALVGVYNKTTEEIPAVEKVEQIGFPGEPNYIAPVEAQDAKIVEVMNKIDEFNFNTEFVEDLRGYKSLYDGLKVKYGGEDLLEGAK